MAIADSLKVDLPVLGDRLRRPRTRSS